MHDFSKDITENKQAFLHKVKVIARKLDTRPEWLLAVMWHESRLNHRALNSIGCVGLIQFCPVTYKAWGLSASTLRNMSNIEQLNYVYKYFKRWKDAGAKYDKPYKLFLTAFYPAALVKGYADKKNYIFGSEKSMSYARVVRNSNKGFDLDGDGYISIKDYDKYHAVMLKKLGIPLHKNNALKIIIPTIIIIAIIIALWQTEYYKKIF